MFLLLCPNCKNRMKYNSRDTSLKNRKKRCVYCGRSFMVSYSIIKEL